MSKKVFIFVSAVIFVVSFSNFALACGCGGGCGGSCGGRVSASSCQDAAQACGGHSAVATGTTLPATAVSVGNVICPVTGQKINDKAKAVYEYEGKEYNLCCAGCVQEFKRDPQKYAMKV